MTPALDAALEAYVAGSGSDADRSTPARRLLTDHKELKGWTGFLVFASLFSSFLVGIFQMAGESRWLLLIPGLIIAASIAFGGWLRANQPDGSEPMVRFLTEALPDLDLAPVQRRYAQALIAVHSGRANDPGGESLALLRRLADEEERLLSLERSVEGVDFDAASAETEAIRTRIASTRDATAREALEQSLALAEGRLASVASNEAIRERLEAHRTITENASRTALESITGGGRFAADMNELRANVASLGRQAEALEAAVQEMRAL